MSFKVFVRLTDRQDHEQPIPFFASSETTDWTAMKLLFSSFYEDAHADDLDVRYWDEEDYVIVSSQEELEEAFRLAEEEERSYMQFYVRLMDKDSLCSNDQLSAAGSSHGTETADHGREKSQPSELPEAEKPRNLSGDAPKQPNSLDDHESMNSGKDKNVDLQKKAPEMTAVQQAFEAEYRPLEHVATPRLLAYLWKHHLDKVAKGTVEETELTHWKKEAVRTIADRDKILAAQATMQEMMTEAGGSSERPTMEQSDEDESADPGRIMLPGALSGANVFAIEMPEMEHQGTESAEPAEIAETGEVTIKSSRDAETGFWMQPQLEAEMKAELRRKLSTVREKEPTSQDRLLPKKHERRSSRLDSGHKKKKHCGEESVGEEFSVSDRLRKEKSSTSHTSSSPFDAVSEETTSGTPPPSHKIHERKRKSSKGEDKKKKHSADLLTEDAFVNYMAKFEYMLKKDVAKEVAKKTVRSVIKNLPKQAEGNEAAASTPVISSKQSGFVHEDIICDCCDREIVGTRYICGNCPNYDLCEECEEIQPSFHDRTHVFIKLRRPCLKAGTRRGVRVPLLKRVIYDFKDEERKVDPGRVQVLMERTKGGESTMERRMSKNNNNSEEGQGGGLDEEDSQDQQEEGYQRVQTLIRASDIPYREIEDSVDENEDTDPQENAVSPVAENVEITEQEAAAADREEEDELAEEVEDLYPECVEDGFVVCSPTQDCCEEQVGDRATSPASSIEVVNTKYYPDMSLQMVDVSQQTMADMLESKWTQCQEQDDVSSLGSKFAGMLQTKATQCQEQGADEVSSLCSLSDDDEDFVVIVPDCFDTSKPLDPASLLRLTREKMSKSSPLENQAEEGPVSDIPPTEKQLGLLKTDADTEASRDMIVHVLPDEREGKSERTVLRSQSEESPGLTIPPPERLSSETNAFEQAMLKLVRPHVAGDPVCPCMDCVKQKKTLTDEEEQKIRVNFLFRGLKAQSMNVKRYTYKCTKPEEMEGERYAAGKETDGNEEGSRSVEGEIPPPTEASSNQLEACTVLVNMPKSSHEVQASETQHHSFRSSAEDPEDSDVPDGDETDLKCPPEFDEDGATAAVDSTLDPNQQLNDIVTNTFKVASTGLQHLYQTGKDIFKTLQRGDSYEPEESSYVFKPAEYKLPESTWQPSNKEFVMPKSNFKVVQKEFHMPKTSYTGPQAQVAPGSGFGGEFSGPLQRIREMGYFNNEHTLALLKKYNGDVEKTVNDLIEETDNNWADQRH